MKINRFVSPPLQHTLVYFSFQDKTTPVSNPGSPAPDWYKDFVTDADAEVLEHSGKMVLLFEILRMAEELGDKVWVIFAYWEIPFSFLIVGFFFLPT